MEPGPRGSGNGGQRGVLSVASVDTGGKQGGWTVVLGWLSRMSEGSWVQVSRQERQCSRVASLLFGDGFGRTAASLISLEPAHPKDLLPRTQLLDLTAKLPLRTSLAETPAARGPLLSLVSPLDSLHAGMLQTALQNCSILSRCLGCPEPSQPCGLPLLSCSWA